MTLDTNTNSLLSLLDGYTPDNSDDIARKVADNFRKRRVEKKNMTIHNPLIQMTANFNSYIDSPAADFWKKLCLREGTLRHYEKGEEFFTAGHVARYFGYIKSGKLKYVAERNM